MHSLPEPWLRGPIEGAHPLTAPLLYAFQQAREDLAHYTAGLSHDQIWSTPHGFGSVGFHLRHIAGSTERLMTYVQGRQLTPEQLAAIASEHEAGHKPEHGAGHKPEHAAESKPEHEAGHKPEHAAEHAAEHKPHDGEQKAEHKPERDAENAAGHKPGADRDTLLAELDRVFREAEAVVRRIDPTTLAEPREVGRQRLPTTVIGLLTHIAEHTQRHVGQAIGAAKWAAWIEP
jgi:uncharacterized damage-inducible protein DinB